MPALLSVNVGLPKDVGWQGRTVHTGVWKHPVPGAAMVRRLNIDGDGQGDLSGHGGEQRAVLVYQIESYRHWEKHFGRDDLEYGQFGENLTVEGMPDDEVCIGDRYRIGEAEFEVTQPRVTCYRVGLRFGEPQLPALLVSHHRPGFYMRVVTEGRVQAGDEIVKIMAGPGALSVADTDALLYLPGHDPAALRRALRIPALSPGWQGSFREMLATADAAADGRLQPEPGPAWPGFRALRVTAVVPETASVSSIQLAAPDASALPPARAGQYITVRITGDGEPAIVRSYSLSSPPGASAYRISVKREPHGAASGYLHDTLSPGDTLEVAAPRGEFTLNPAESGPVLLISAGIGATPVLAMLQQLAAAHAHRQVWWIHAARGPREHPFAAEARSLLASLPDARECLFYSAATDTEARDGGAARGRLTPAALAGLGLPGDASAYLCGPAGFMADVRQALVAAGLDAARIRTEAFGALDASTPGLVGVNRRPPHPPDRLGIAPGAGPQVTFARSGISTPYSVPGAGSLLELADACDVPARWACRTGVCHTCVTPLLSGSISYSPDPLEPPAAGQVLICCARPVTDVVLDM